MIKSFDYSQWHRAIGTKFQVAFVGVALAMRTHVMRNLETCSPTAPSPLPGKFDYDYTEILREHVWLISEATHQASEV